MSVKRQCQIRNPGWAHLSSPAWRAVTSAVPCAEVGRDVRFVLSESTMLSFTVSVCQVVRRGPLFSRFALASRLALAHDESMTEHRAPAQNRMTSASSPYRRTPNGGRRGCRVVLVGYFTLQGAFSVVFFPRPFEVLRRRRRRARRGRQWHKNVIRACRYIFRDHYGYYFEFFAPTSEDAKSGVAYAKRARERSEA